MPCTATIHLDDSSDTTCALDAGHAGPVHQDGDGIQWGDPLLPEPAPPEDEA